jgi:hypothetical protein
MSSTNYEITVPHKLADLMNGIVSNPSAACSHQLKHDSRASGGPHPGSAGNQKDFNA